MTTNDLDSVIASFLTGSASAAPGDTLIVRTWSDDDWKRVFGFATLQSIKAGDALIRRGEPERKLYFILRGRLEVVIDSRDGLSLGPLTRVGAGSVLGEQSFFDASPRSASAWAVDDCDVAAMSPDQFAALEKEHPGQARDLLFALGRILAARLRSTTAKVRG